jgi:glutamate---cysteine ligase / carboxylate-amine ligase
MASEMRTPARASETSRVIATPAWAHWNSSERRYTVGVEEELMLLDASIHAPAPSSEAVHRGLSRALARHVSLETHASVIELRTGVHASVAGAVKELKGLRLALAQELEVMGLCAIAAGTYPLHDSRDTHVSNSERYRLVAETMRALARRQPTLALHVHVGVPDPSDAIRVLNGLRSAVPILLALSANSPFCDGHDTGFASARTVIFQAFPRTGTARSFASYDDYCEAVDALISCGAIQDPTFLWWDVRLQPALGTVEIRVMDTQSDVSQSEALIALVQSMVSLQLEEGGPNVAAPPEVLAENRFLAARDGMDARFIDPVRGKLLPVRAARDTTLSMCRDHAIALGCDAELDLVPQLAACNGAESQRLGARRDGLPAVVDMLVRQFAGPGGDLEVAAQRDSGRWDRDSR